MSEVKKAQKKSTAKKATAALVIGLADIVAAGAAGMFTSPEVHASLVEAGLVEVNPTMVNEDGEIATRATQAGIESMQELDETKPQAQAKAKAVASHSTFAIEDDVPMPTGSARGRGGNTYPFEQLEVGQSFFVPNSEDKPNAAKSLASTVSSATSRFAVRAEDGSVKLNRKGELVPVMVETRKFVVRSVEGGARVWRTQ